MTRDEFLPGWTLLTTQPWGQLYDGRLDLQKARVQFEYYYEQLGWATKEAWTDVAKLYAAGEKWPNVAELKRAATELNRRYVRALPEPEQPTTADPQEAEAILTRLLGRPFQFK